MLINEVCTMAAKICLNFIAAFIPKSRAAKVSIALIAKNQIIGAAIDPIKTNILANILAISIPSEGAPSSISFWSIICSIKGSVTHAIPTENRQKMTIASNHFGSDLRRVNAALGSARMSAIFCKLFFIVSPFIRFGPLRVSFGNRCHRMLLQGTAHDFGYDSKSRNRR